MSKVIVIGGGASGLISALFASKNNHDVTLIEKNEKLGKKIYITGKGRCNLTNNCQITDFLENVVTNKKFMYSSINAFSPSDTINFFENLGLKLKTERGNRVFPESDKASDVTKYLQKEIEKQGVKIKLNETVLNLICENDIIKGVITNKSKYFAENVIICTGGLSYPLTGSTGDGYAFAKALGLNVTKLYPSLVGFNVKEDFYKELQGLSLKNVNFTVKNGQKIIFSEQGELLFTHFGISGPTVISASSYINKMDLNNLVFSIDFKPALTYEVLDKRIQRELIENNVKEIATVMRSLLPQSLIKEVLIRSQIKRSKICSEISKEERERLIITLKEFNFKPKSIRSFDEAIVTSGGVDVKEINPKTMESKKIKRLFFAGEVIDVDCLTGGFNLQTAFSTGYVAGNNIN